MARPDAVSPACYPHSLDLRFMQFSLYLGLRAPHVQLCSRTMNSSGRVVSTRAFSNSETGLFRLRELVEVFHSDKPCREDCKDCSPTAFMCSERSAVSSKTISNSTAELGAVLQGIPQRRVFGIKAIHSLIQAPGHLPVKAECH